jgi:amylosucrase
MHRPFIDWEKNKNIDKNGTIEHRISSASKKPISKRKNSKTVADKNNLTWMTPHNICIAGYVSGF